MRSLEEGIIKAQVLFLVKERLGSFSWNTKKFKVRLRDVTSNITTGIKGVSPVPL
jgi:copper homeostasis protein CutC